MSHPEENVKIAVQREPDALDLPLPSYATDGSSGMDLYAMLPADGPRVLQPGERAMISTGIRMAVPVGYEAQVRPRSGLAIKCGLTDSPMCFTVV